MPADTLILVYSYHHNNTLKLAKTIASTLNAEIKSPEAVTPEELRRYKLIGFGSGIYSSSHHISLLNLANSMNKTEKGKVFLFSTFGAPKFIVNDKFISDNHKPLRDILISKGYEIAGEFGCAGLNTNSFLKYFGGINKGRPDAEDLKRAERFAVNLG